MQKMKFSAKLVSLLLMISCLVSVFSVFAFANAVETTEEVTDSVNVVLNRTFDEGWDYDNGFSDAFAGDNKVAIRYELTDSGYNHYLRFEKASTDVSYVNVDTSKLDKTGKTYVEFDLASSLNNTMGQAVRVSVQGNLKTLVEFKDDGMYILGENVGHPDYAMKWESVAFEFDFDYSENTAGVAASAYKVTAYYNNAVVASAVYNCGFGGFGISQIRFSFGNVLATNNEQWYAIDNISVYSGVDSFTVLEEDEYGSAVNSALVRDFPLATLATGADGFLYGEPKLSREEDPHGLVNHYNRSYDEGWDYNNYYTGVDRLTVSNISNEYAIKKEKVGDDYNHFLRFRALSTTPSFLDIPVVNAPDYGRLVLELDLKAGVNVNMGGIVQVNGSSSEWVISIENGQLVIFDHAVGYIGNDWVRVVLAFDYEEEDDGYTYCTVYYGSAGYLKQRISYNNISQIRIGMESGAPEDCYGDWYGVDNIQIYSGIPGFAVLDENDYGLGVYSAAKKDFDLNSGITPDTPVEPDINDDETGDRENVITNNYISGSPALDRIEYDEANVWLQYHRVYSEGWSFGVGGGNPSGIITSLENEQLLDLSYNYFQRYEGSETGNKYWTLTASGTCPTNGKVYVELDVRAVDGADFGGVFQVRTTSAASGSQSYLVGFDDGYLVVWGQKIGKVSEDQWVHIAFEFDYDYAMNTPGADPNTFKLRAYIGDEWYFEKVITGKTATTNFGISGFRIGFESCPSTCFGQFWDMDNLMFYSASDFVDIPDDKYGNLVNTATPKDFPIQTTAVTLQQMINDSLFMKVGCQYSLVNNTRQPVLYNEETGVAYGAPKNINGTVWIPLDAILNFLNYPIYIHEDGQSFDISTGSTITYITLGRDTASVAGKKVQLSAAPAVITGENEYLAIAADDVDVLFPEFSFMIDDMNMVVFSPHSEIVDNPLDQDTRIGIMKDFIFEYIKAEEIYDRVQDNTNNFDHPYIIANQAKFDELHEVWLVGQEDDNDGDPYNTSDYDYDPTLYSYIKSIVNSARSSYNKFSIAQMTAPNSTVDDDYAGLIYQAYVYDSETSSLGLQHPYKDSAGYDPIGGRLNPPFDPIVGLAYAYQVTRDERFALMVFDYTECLAHWDHWGPGHFLNCADTASPMGIAYDWCYDVWVANGLDTEVIADAIYYHGALQGYLVTVGKPDPHGRAGGNGSTYTTMVNNWNAVCTSGMATAALSILDYTGLAEDTRVTQARHRVAEYGGTKMTGVLTYLIASNFKTLIEHGLEIYAPDGSYEEGVSYWAYGAGNLFQYSAVLRSAFGTDLGIMDTWGIDRTCNSIVHMVSSDNVAFAYNDSSVGGSFSSGYFNYVAYSLDDDFLRVIRRMQISEFNVSRSIYDSIYYKNLDGVEDVELPLQYHHIGINGYTMRSSWDRGAIFAGMLGGDNNDGHGHLDAGQFVYYNKGISWIEDIGPDGYNTYNYFSNNHMYKTTVEGHSCILLTSLQDSVPAGQLRDSVSPVLTVGDNEYGAFATFDTNPAFGPKAFFSCTRGIMLTNDRKTVIIQDEIVPQGTQTFYWLAHYNNKTITSVEISESGRIVYMTALGSDKQEYTLRIQMVSTIRNGITFEKMTTQDYLLDATMRPGDSEAMGKQPEGDRSMWSKLAIKFSNLTFYEFAVALEVIDPNAPVPVGYSFTKMAEWEPYADTRVPVDNVVEEDTSTTAIRTTVSSSEIPQNISRLNGFYNNGTIFSTDISRFYRTITSMTFAVNKYGRDTKVNQNERADADGNMRPAIEIYDEYYAMYDEYFEAVDLIASQISSITTSIIGG